MSVLQIINQVLHIAEHYIENHKLDSNKKHIWMQVKDHQADFKELRRKMETIFNESREGLKHIEGFVNEKENKFLKRKFLPENLKKEGKEAFREIRSKIEEMKRRLDQQDLHNPLHQPISRKYTVLT